jgi:hypothetical protein
MFWIVVFYIIIKIEGMLNDYLCGFDQFVNM